LTVSTTFEPELTPPRLSGLGPTLRLVIPETALAAIPPREQAQQSVAAVLESLVKAPFKFMFLRFCGLAMAGSAAVVLLSALGPAVGLYPLAVNPELAPLLWAAVWVGWALANLAGRFTRRIITVQLLASAAELLKDEGAVSAALKTLAAKNLEPDSRPAWQEIFRRRVSRAKFLKELKILANRPEAGGRAR
jgi:hypothetical protein